MTTGIVIAAFFLTCVCATSVQAQNTVSTSPSASDSRLTRGRVASVSSSPNETIPLRVPKGTAVQVVLDKEVRIQKVGQPIHGLVAEPVYAFDKLVVPVGTQVTGQITQLEMEKSSNFYALDAASQRALLLTARLAPLPSAFPDDHLTVHLSFEYQRK